MSNLSVFDELDQAIDHIIADPALAPSSTQPAVAELLDIASDLRELPRADFKMQLRVELQWQALGNRVAKDQDHAPAGKPQLVKKSRAEADILPTLFGKGYGTYPVRSANFAVSVALHAMAMLVVVGLGLFMVQEHGKTQVRTSMITSLVTDYVPPAGSKLMGGGGGGGDASKLHASHGQLPQTAQQQITPPTVTISNLHPKVAIAPTIVAPDLKMPLSRQTGDPLSALTTPSNSTGVRGGSGAGNGGGIGSGDGGGFGPGTGGNFGGGVFRVGNGVTAPRAIFSPDPEYSDEARKAKYQGTVTLWAIIGPDGRPRQLRVERSLGMGLDEKAIEAVRNWRFDPATKDGHAVAVMINVQVDFHLY